MRVQETKALLKTADSNPPTLWARYLIGSEGPEMARPWRYLIAPKVSFGSCPGPMAHPSINGRLRRDLAVHARSPEGGCSPTR